MAKGKSECIYYLSDNVKAFKADLAKLAELSAALAARRDAPEADLRKRDEISAGALHRENAIKAKLAYAKDELCKKRVECDNLCWPSSDIVAKVRRAKSDVVEALSAVTWSAKNVHAGESTKIQAEYEQTWKCMTSQLDLESAKAIANVCSSLEEDCEEVHRNISRCKSLVSGRLSIIEKPNVAVAEVSAAVASREVTTESVQERVEVQDSMGQ